MSRTFRILGKKKGRRQTGSRWWAGVGEVVFAASLILIGIVLLIVVTTLQIQYSTTQTLYIPLGYFVPELLVSLLLLLIGFYRVLVALWSVGASVERRGAILSRAREINLLNEVRPRSEELPFVPTDLFDRASPGLNLKYRLHSNFRATWKLTMALLVCLLFVSVTTILAMTTLQSTGTLLLGLAAGNWISLGLVLVLLIISVWSIFFFLRQLLAQTGIGPTKLEISNYPLKPGDVVQLHVLQPGRVRLKLLNIDLLCVEGANFDQGTDVRFETRTVFRHRLLRKRGVQLATGQPFEATMDLSVPENAMHSFQSASNRVLWRIVVQCHAKGWPRFERVYPILVLPPIAPRPAGTEPALTSAGAE